MATLAVRTGGVLHRLAYDPAAGLSLRAILEPTDFRVRTACLGLGACGLCRVRVLAGEVGAPTTVERAQLEDPLLAGGVRLACQCRPAGEVELEVLSPAPPTSWRIPPGGSGAIGPLRWKADPAPPHALPRPLGVAVDLGTSHISVAVIDLAGARPLALRVGANPQRAHGADVMTRLVVAGDPGHAHALASLARAAVGEALGEIARSEGIDLRRVRQALVVGNTAMLGTISACSSPPAGRCRSIARRSRRRHGDASGGLRRRPRSRWWRRWRVSSDPTCSRASSPSACRTCVRPPC